MKYSSISVPDVSWEHLASDFGGEGGMGHVEGGGVRRNRSYGRGGEEGEESDRHGNEAKERKNKKQLTSQESPNGEAPPS